MTKDRAKNCVTHHYACDCREYEFAQVRAERDALKATLEGRCTFCRAAPRMKDAKTCERCAL